ncbi:MAG: hypothetical protein QOK16_4744 [Solirubrobacteraceae bacterium]|nr:hypothetical protein [Solirubrobacteraceae bacterium]
MSEQQPDPRSTDALLAAGEAVDRVEVTIGPKFLQLFSEQLYTSPNKAFEELVSNSWDAGAGVVHIGIPDDLAADDAILWVLDDGVGMDVATMRLLWAVGDDHKARSDWDAPRGRDQIGKFGIGKLATFVLANQLTYICKAGDGVLRAVSVDYREILRRGDAQALHVEPLPLDVRTLSDHALTTLLDELGLVDVKALIDGGAVSRPENDGAEDDEFHALEDDDVPDTSTTWTLAVMSALKPRGQGIQRGHVRRMLRAALPLGNSIMLVLNGEQLAPTKIDASLQGSWVLGSDYAPDSITPERDRQASEDDAGDDVAVTAAGGAEPHIDIPGVGKVTGEIKLYEKSIAGGKSADRAPSNGFHVNVRGRVINLQDEHFGMPALSHGVWAKLRVTVRADGLNRDLAVTRESVEDSEEVRIFRGLLRATFNFARLHYPEASGLPDIHDLLRDQWGTVPISPLLDVVDDAVSTGEGSDLVDLTGVETGEQAALEVRKSIEDRPEDALRDVQARPHGAAARLARYHVADRSVVINSDHPYWIEQLTGDSDKKDLLTTAATVALLGDAYLLQLGVAHELVDDLRGYRDQVERLIASSRRRSALTLAGMLDEASTQRTSLENIVAECLDYFGFHVHHQAQTGKPEGIATADLAPDAADRPRRYRFIYEAKSTMSADRKVSTKDVNVSGQDRHRRHAAGDTDDLTEVEYALVIAPGFQAGALQDECGALNVCPMRTADLGRLLVGVAVSGPLDQERFRAVLRCSDPDDVASEITSLISEARGRVSVTIAELVEALQDLDNIGRLNAGMVAMRMRQRRNERDGARHPRPSEDDVRTLLGGLQMLAPSAVQLVSDQIVLGTRAHKLSEAIRIQAAHLPEEYRFELDRLAGDRPDAES